MKKKYVVVTGGAGFIGSNLCKKIIKETKFHIIVIDNYSSGRKSNHIRNKRVIYIKGNTKQINWMLDLYKKKIHSLFHFAEYSRIYQSFLNFDQCFDSNTIGSKAVFKFCLDNKIKLVYSATSASLGNQGRDKDLSPYAFTKAKNLELLNNLKKWFGFKFEIIYFYNVYGPAHITDGSMATVIGIFERQYLSKKPLTVVKPGNQTRRFTHVFDTIDVCFKAWKLNKCSQYSITHKESYSIIEVAKMFNSKIKKISARKGERYASALTKLPKKDKIIIKYGKISLKDYISSFIKPS